MKSLFFLAISVLVISCYSCNNSGNANQSGQDSTANVQKPVADDTIPDLTGHYALPKESGDLNLTITKENSVFKYNLKGDDGKLDVYGTLSIRKESTDIYLTFDGPIENNKPKSVEAVYREGIIVIQNTGNADQGSWVLFPYCSAKYLEFTKK